MLYASMNFSNDWSVIKGTLQYTYTCSHNMMVNFTYINETLKTLGKECDVSFKPSHSFAYPFAYCSVAHRILLSCTSQCFFTPSRLIHDDKDRCSEW